MLGNINNEQMKHAISPVSESEYPEVVNVWEASVRATHHFLTEADIQFFKPLILNDYLKAVDLRAVRNEANQLTGFLGVHKDKIEMLFVHPDEFGNGIGKDLTKYAVNQLSTTKVDVNEDNEQAVGFYQHMGFAVISRDALDSLGKPFPILHMELKN